MKKEAVAAFRDEMEKIAVGLPHVLAGGLIGLLLGARLWRGKDKGEQEASEQNVQRALPGLAPGPMAPGLESTPLVFPRNKINRMHDALRAYDLEPEAGEVNPEEDMLRFAPLGSLFGGLGKLGQAPGSLAHRAQLGAPGAWGSLQGGGGAGGAGGGPPPPAPSGPPGGAGGDPGIPAGGPPGGAGGGDPLGGAGKPMSASDLGIGGGGLGGAAKTPSASDLGIPGGGDPTGGGKVAEPPPATTAATGRPPAEATAAGRMAASQKASTQVQSAVKGGFQPGESSRPSASDLGIPE
jgi:hypothetical protein